jgi:hypothetical protein
MPRRRPQNGPSFSKATYGAASVDAGKLAGRMLAEKTKERDEEARGRKLAEQRKIKISN